MFRLKITVMAIFTEIYSFNGRKCRTGHKMSYGTIFHPFNLSFLWGTH